MVKNVYVKLIYEEMTCFHFYFFKKQHFLFFRAAPRKITEHSGKKYREKSEDRVELPVEFDEDIARLLLKIEAKRREKLQQCPAQLSLDLSSIAGKSDDSKVAVNGTERSQELETTASRIQERQKRLGCLKVELFQRDPVQGSQTEASSLASMLDEAVQPSDKGLILASDKVPALACDCVPAQGLDLERLPSLTSGSDSTSVEEPTLATESKPPLFFDRGSDLVSDSGPKPASGTEDNAEVVFVPCCCFPVQIMHQVEEISANSPPGHICNSCATDASMPRKQRIGIIQRRPESIPGLLPLHTENSAHKSSHRTLEKTELFAEGQDKSPSPQNGLVKRKENNFPRVNAAEQTRENESEIELTKKVDKINLSGNSKNDNNTRKATQDDKMSERLIRKESLEAEKSVVDVALLLTGRETIGKGQTNIGLESCHVLPAADEQNNIHAEGAEAKDEWSPPPVDIKITFCEESSEEADQVSFSNNVVELKNTDERNNSNSSKDTCKAKSFKDDSRIMNEEEGRLTGHVNRSSLLTHQISDGSVRSDLAVGPLVSPSATVSKFQIASMAKMQADGSLQEDGVAVQQQQPPRAASQTEESMDDLPTTLEDPEFENRLKIFNNYRHFGAMYSAKVTTFIFTLCHGI
jgi:hypothetical protein